MLKNTKYILAVITVLIFTFTAGCDQNVAENPSSSGDSKAGTQQQKAVSPQSDKNGENAATVKVYFASEDGTKLVATTKPTAQDAPDKYAAAIQTLLAGSKESGVVTVIPVKTKLRSVNVENGVAYVDFSGELVKNFNGGSTGEIMLVGSIVNTLTEFPEVKAVQILINGAKVETIAGHMDLSEPLRRFDHI